MEKDYKKQRDKALRAMVKFSKLGDKKMAEAYLNLAVEFNNLRTVIEPIKMPAGYKLIK